MIETLMRTPNALEQTVGETTEKSSQKSSQKIIIAMQENREVTIEELADQIGISARAIKKSVALLKKLGSLHELARIKVDIGKC